MANSPALYCSIRLSLILCGTNVVANSIYYYGSLLFTSSVFTVAVDRFPVLYENDKTVVVTNDCSAARADHKMYAGRASVT